MNKIKFYAISAAQNIALALAFVFAGLAAAKYGLLQDKRDYKEYKLKQSRHVFKNN